MPEKVSRKKTTATTILGGWIKHGPHWDYKIEEYGWYYSTNWSGSEEQNFIPNYSPIFATFAEVLDWLAENVRVCDTCGDWLRRVEGNGVCSDCQEQASTDRMAAVDTPDDPYDAARVERIPAFGE